MDSLWLISVPLRLDYARCKIESHSHFVDAALTILLGHRHDVVVSISASTVWPIVRLWINVDA